MYEELIGYIIDGYDNSKLQKLVNLKKIRIQGIRDVNDKTRSIVIKNLKTKSNLFEIYKIWNSKKTKEIQLTDVDRNKFEEILLGSTVSKNQTEFLSRFLYKMIVTEGIEDTLFFWENNKEKINKLESEKISKIDLKQEKINNDDLIDKRHLNEISRLIKKQEKERKNWQNIENNLNKQLQKSKEEILKIQQEVKNYQKKYNIKLEELNKELKKGEGDLAELVRIKEYKKSAELELLSIKDENRRFHQDSIKKNGIITDLNLSLKKSEKEINKLNKIVMEIKNNINYKDISIESDVDTEKVNDNKKNNTTIFLENIKSNSTLQKVQKNADSKNNCTEIKKQKILVFGDITGLDYEETLFEIYTSNLMPKDIAILREEDYKAIWLIKYRFPKKFQRSQVMKNFNKINVINNFIELEGVYRNEL